MTAPKRGPGRPRTKPEEPEFLIPQEMHRFDQPVTEEELYQDTLQLTHLLLREPDVPTAIKLRLMLKVLGWQSKVGQQDEKDKLRAEVQEMFTKLKDGRPDLRSVDG